MMREDRGWFLLHPGEVERLRDPMPHEFCPRDDECRPLAHPDFVLVREVVPGLRYRLPMTIDTTAVVS